MHLATMSDREKELEELRVDLLEKELQDKEEKIDPLVFKNLFQKFLLLESLGVLTALSENAGTEITSYKFARIITDLLGEKSFETVRRTLRSFHPHHRPTDKNNLRSEKNLTKLHSVLIKLDLTNHAEKVEKELREIHLKED